MLKGVSLKGVRAIRYSTSAEDTDPASFIVASTALFDSAEAYDLETVSLLAFELEDSLANALYPSVFPA